MTKRDTDFVQDGLLHLVAPERNDMTHFRYPPLNEEHHVSEIETLFSTHTTLKVASGFAQRTSNIASAAAQRDGGKHLARMSARCVFVRGSSEVP